VGAAQVAEDGVDHQRLEDEGDDLHPPVAAAGAGQGINLEEAAMTGKIDVREEVAA
jgi:hypothetical protein